MTDYPMEAEFELASLPVNYSLEKALQQKDIIRYGTQSYNTNRIQQFIENANNNIEDKIRITNYSDNTSPTIGVLMFNGSSIIFTQRHIIDNRLKYATYYGHSIKSKFRTKRNLKEKVYLLVTFSKLEVVVFCEKMNR